MPRVGVVSWVLWIRYPAVLGLGGGSGVRVGLGPGLLWLRLHGLVCQPMLVPLGWLSNQNSVYQLCQRPELESGYQISDHIFIPEPIDGRFEGQLYVGIVCPKVMLCFELKVLSIIV